MKEKTKTADFSRKPGRFSRGRSDKPLLKRVRPNIKSTLADKLDEILSHTFKDQEDECIRLAGIALTTLELLLGKTKKKATVNRSKLEKRRSTELEEAKVMVARLAGFLSKNVPQALSARVHLREDGTLVRDEPLEKPPEDEERRRLNADSQAVLYASAALLPKNDVIRLYK